MPYNEKAMKAAVLVGPGKVEVRDWPKPGLKNAADVLLRVRTVGICGSDLHYFSEEKVGDTVMHYPVVLGHECAAVVEETGPGVRRLRPGDRVALEPAISCGACDQCLSGRANTCRELEFLGHPKERSGALAEFIVMPEENCYVLRRDMTFTQATLAEPLSIALHAVNLAGDLKGRTIGILGSGPIGLGVGLAAHRAGAAATYMTDKVAARVRAASREAGRPLGREPRSKRTSSGTSSSSCRGALTSSSSAAGSRRPSTRPSTCLSPAGLLSSSASPSRSGYPSTSPGCGAARSASRTSGARTSASSRPCG